jgi:transposase-like protein
MKRKNGKKSLTDHVILTIHPRHVAGESITKLADELNVYPQNLYRRFEEMGLWVRPWNEARNGQKTLPPVTLEQATQAVQMVNDGLTRADVSRKIGVDWHRLRWAINKFGLNVQDSSARNTRSLTPEKMEVLKQYKTANMTKQQLAEKLELPLSTITYWLIRLNLRQYKRQNGGDNGHDI